MGDCVFFVQNFFQHFPSLGSVPATAGSSRLSYDLSVSRPWKVEIWSEPPVPKSGNLQGM